MKNPFEKPKKWIKNTLLGTVATVGMSAPVFGSEKELPSGVLDKSSTHIENIIPATDSKNNREVVNFAAEQEIQLKLEKLEQKRTEIESKIQKLTGQLQSYQVDFSSNYQEAVHFLGEKPKANGFELRLADLVKKYAEERVGKEDITSPDAVNGLLGILLSGEGKNPLKKDLDHLMAIVGQQLGSAVMQTTNKPGKYESPDMSIHKHLGEDPKLIVQTTLSIVQESHNLDKITKEINDLLEIPAEIVAQK